MENETKIAQTLADAEPDTQTISRRELLQEMLAGNETDLKDEEPACYILGYN